MTPELWKRLQLLYDAALDTPKEKRAQFIAEQCGSDNELRRELEALLAANEAASGSLDVPFVNFRDFAKKQAFSVRDLILNRFRIVRFIDFGGMGEVYEAEDNFLHGVHVALKTILPNVASNPDLQKRFEREVLLAREVTHSNLCPIYDIFHCEDPPPGYLFLTMKLLPGQTLGARLKKPPPMNTDEGLAVLRQTSLGLAAIHAAGIIHRDIKPNNIMVDGSGANLRLWITDFGLARAHETESTQSSVGTVAGTLGYIAPELYLGHPPSQASDLFALGVVLHEVFTGQKPTPVPDTHSYKVSPQLTTPKVPALSVRLITECLQDEPQRRCTAFAEALTVIDSKLDRSNYTGRTSRLWTRRRFAGVAAAGVCAVAGGAWWKRDEFEDMRHPLPQKRFVALLNWPKTSDVHLTPTLNGALNAIKSQLSRLEAFDRNLLVISTDDPGTGVEEAAHLRKVCDSLGANLVLAASGLVGPNRFQVFLHLMDPISGHTLRKKTLDCALNAITSLPGKAVEAAEALLDLRQYLHNDATANPGTQSPAAFTAFQSAEVLMRQPNDTGLDEGIEKYKDAVELDPRFALAHAKLAIAYVHLYGTRRDPGALDLARGNCEHALALDPNLVDGHLARAVLWQQTGNEQGALDELEKTLALDPSNPETLSSQALVFVRLNRWADAEQVYQRILNQRPNYWVTYNDRGYALDRQGKYREAVKSFRAATVAAPGNSLAFANLGGEYLEIGDFAEATESSKKSLALKPNDLAAANASFALRFQGKSDEALPFALKAVELNPADDINWLELAECYSSLGNRPNEAKAAYSRAAKEAERHLQTDATNGPAWMLFALYKVKSGSPQDAPSLIQKAETLGADDIDSQLYKARILELLGKRDAALATLAACFRRGATALQIEPFPDLQSLRKDPRYRKIVALNSIAVPATEQ